MREDLNMTVYVALFNKSYRVFYTHNPAVDARYTLNIDPEAELIFLTPFLPIGIAYSLYKNAFVPRETAGRVGMGFKRFVDLKNRSIQENLARILSQLYKKGLYKKDLQNGSPKGLPVWMQEVGSHPIKVSARFLADERSFQAREMLPIKKCLEGRLLFLEELEQAMEQNQYSIKDNLNDILQWLALDRQLEILPSLLLDERGKVKCFRCENDVERNFYQSHCCICGSDSLYCRQCVDYGESRLCRAIFSSNPSDERVALEDKTISEVKKISQDQTISEEKNIKDNMYTLARDRLPALSPAQKAASEELVDFIKRKRRHICLLWAVAGAGKTEVVLEAADTILKKGGRVLYAAPRRDVVIELAPRLQHYFPGPPIAESYGGSQLKYLNTSIVAATTHQVLRYRHSFDLVILDEADAYPYKDNKMLHTAVRRAVKEDGQIIDLTATPDENILAEVKRGVADMVTIPARHHGCPLPEPKLHKAVSFTGDSPPAVNPYIIELLASWLNDEKRQVFVFLPTVTLTEMYGPVLQRALSERIKQQAKLRAGSDRQQLLEYSHARDKARDEKRDAFKQGRVRVFVTTTIMERGITVKKANVLVLNADYERVFDQGTLIQMAGRAGRSREYPHGEVVFIGEKISNAMKEALNRIQFLNRTAREKGYLRKGL